jgi:DsbC/DsbD-like thiol-disulfide interchange protein
MIARSVLMISAVSSMAFAAERSGQARADWISSSTSFQPGKPVQTAIRMVVDPGWHTYWSNPGEAGMKPKVTWDLPEGWSAGEMLFPVPRHFSTGGLAGYGYEGMVIFPVTLTPPASATGKMELKGKISWLSCNDDSCVPGSAELKLVIHEGPPADSESVDVVAKALTKIPKPADRVTLKVSENDGQLQLSLVSDRPSFDPSACEIFPVTPQAVDPANPIRFEKDGSSWSAVVAKNEYATAPLRRLTLVIAGKGVAEPIEVTWNAK